MDNKKFSLTFGKKIEENSKAYIIIENTSLSNSI